LENISDFEKKHINNWVYLYTLNVAIAMGCRGKNWKNGRSDCWF